MKKFKAILYARAKQAIPLIAKLLGINLLNKQATLKKLGQYQLYFEKGTETLVSAAGVTGAAIPLNFSQSLQVATSSVGVYRVSGGKNIKIYPFGGVKLNNCLLDLDFGTALFVQTLIKTDKRAVIKTETCVVLWSHYWGNGYYDYLFFIYAKLLRVKSVMGAAEFKQAKIAYPLFGTAFEKELLQFAGVDNGQLVDVRKFTVQAGNYYLADNDDWYFHNQVDLHRLRDALKPFAGNYTPVKPRLYIQRKGRRVLTNEDEVLKVLAAFDFTVIADEPRQVAEQIRLYAGAEVIIGPHGASFANIINCRPGTILIELFPNSYYPDYFRYLASVFGLNYFALFEDDLAGNHYRNLTDNMVIDPGKVERVLSKLLR